jgi:hypothetical protein
MIKKCPVCGTKVEEYATNCQGNLCGWQFIQLLSDSLAERTAYESKLSTAKANYADKLQSLEDHQSKKKKRKAGSPKLIDVALNHDGKATVESKDGSDPSTQFEIAQAAFEREDYLEAYKWYVKSANQGSINAQYKLGLIYRHGFGVEQNYKQAKIWFDKAADQGHDEAIEQLTTLDRVTLNNFFMVAAWTILPFIFFLLFFIAHS